MQMAIDYISPSQRLNSINQNMEKHRVSKLLKQAAEKKKLGIENIERGQKLVEQAEAVIREHSFIGRVSKKISEFFNRGDV